MSTLTKAELKAWLGDPEAAPCVLVEAKVLSGEVEITRYMSDMGYVTGTTESGGVPAHTAYESVIIGGCETTETMTIDGDAAMATGEIEISNMNGERDAWLTDIWRNREIKMFIGDLRWTRDKFLQIFTGVTNDIVPSGLNVIAITVRDKLQRLNTAVMDEKLGGDHINSEKLVPVLFGECHNIEPLLISRVAALYHCHNGEMQGFIEVRNDGVVVPVAVETPVAGMFQLAATANTGIITCSAAGAVAGGYQNNVYDVIFKLVTQYGVDKFAGLTDVDMTAGVTFKASNPQAVGYYCKDRENVLDVCSKIARSIGAQLYSNSLGLLKLVKIELPAFGSPTSVDMTNIKEGTFELVERVPVKAAIKLGYCKNWTVQNNLQTGIPPEHKAMYAEEWLTVTATDDTVATNYKLTDEPIQEDTYLITKAAAQGEANRRLALWKVPRSIYQYEGFPELMLEELAGPQVVTYDRYNLQNSASAQILQIRKNWLTRRPLIQVLI